MRELTRRSGGPSGNPKAEAKTSTVEKEVTVRRSPRNVPQVRCDKNLDVPP